MRKSFAIILRDTYGSKEKYSKLIDVILKNQLTNVTILVAFLIDSLLYFSFHFFFSLYI